MSMGLSADEVVEYRAMLDKMFALTKTDGATFVFEELDKLVNALDFLENFGSDKQKGSVRSLLRVVRVVRNRMAYETIS